MNFCAILEIYILKGYSIKDCMLEGATLARRARGTICTWLEHAVLVVCWVEIMDIGKEESIYSYCR